MANKHIAIKKASRRLLRNQSGLAVVEFAVSLPFFLGLTVAGIETANYASVVMQLNQITIHAADSAARMGEGSQLATKIVSESHINDVFAGAIREGDSLVLDGQHSYTDPGTGNVSLRGNAKMWLSSVEPVAAFNAGAPKYRMRWQRCLGSSAVYAPTYGKPSNTTSVDGVGPTGRQIAAPPSGAVMFVETKYYYKPLLFGDLNKIKEQTVSHYAAMVVRDNRHYAEAAADGTPTPNGVKAVAGVTPSTCTYPA